MNAITFDDDSTNKVCILTTSPLAREPIETAYLNTSYLYPKDVVAIQVHKKQGAKKTPVTEIKEFIKDELLPTILDSNIEYLLCTDPEYFKQLTGLKSAESNIGYVCDCSFGSWKVLYLPTHKAIFYDPEKVVAKIKTALSALHQHRNNVYIHPTLTKTEAYYPKTAKEVELALTRLLKMNVPFTCDIETFSLKHDTAGIGSISFAWSSQEGFAFAVDLNQEAEQIRWHLNDFFRNNTQKVIFHNIAFDAYVLIYQLYMSDILDTEGLLSGIDIMLKNWECTKLIAYLATNSCAGNDLSLKQLTQKHAGNYAVDVKDITQVDVSELLEYNLTDALATWFVYNEYYPKMVADDQLDIYESLFKPTTVDIIQMQLTGMPLNMETVKEVKQQLQASYDDALKRIHNSPQVMYFNTLIRSQWVTNKNATYKKKRVTVLDAPHLVYNPNSGPQTQELLFEVLGLPVLAYTASKQPATGGEALKTLIPLATDPDIKDLLSAMVDYKSVDKILTSFIPAFESASLGPDGWHYLFGNFNLGGTVSGRLSSSNP